jgi:hypothetical protein
MSPSMQSNKPMVPTATRALAEPARRARRRHIGQPLGSDRRSPVRPRIDGGGTSGYWWGFDHIARRTAETEPGRQELLHSFRSRLER